MQQTTATTYDVVVVGSGAAGLTSALVLAQRGLSVAVVEKAAVLGGTTATSGGAAWIPGNPLMKDAGQSDSREEARTYLRAILGNRYDEAFVEAFLDSGPALIAHLEATSEVSFYPVSLSDYKPDLPGAKLARTIIAREYDGRRLGSMVRHVRNPLPGFAAFRSFQADPQDIGKLTAVFRTWEGFTFTMRRLATFAAGVVRHGKGTHMANGNALAGRLIKSAMDHGVTFLRSAPVEELVIRDGRVRGVVVRRSGTKTTVVANRAVILASGGFGANTDWREKFMPLPEAHLSAQPAENVGDGIVLGTSAGGRVAEPNAANGVWAPCSALRDADGNVVTVYPHFGPDRGKPGSIIVDPAGKRFYDEAAPYQDFVNAMNERGLTTAWFIAERPALRRYGMGLALPAPLPIGRLIKAGYLIEAPTLPELAARIGVPAEALCATVAAFNESARVGVDAEFGKGSNIYDNAQGDPGHKPNPNLGPLEQGPFYAVRLHPGDCSSILGLRTSVDGEVVDETGRAIPGLFAAGLDQDSFLHGEYPGGGSSIGPAMTFAYRAALRIAADKEVSHA